MAAPSDRTPSVLQHALADVLKRLQAGSEPAPEPQRLTQDLHGLAGELAAERARGATPAPEAHPSRAGDEGAPAPTASASPSSELIERLAAHAPKESRYRGMREIARGGMGAVLEAYDPDLRRVLAIKVALEPEPSLDPRRRRERTARFLEEAQITGQLDHPGIVPVHEIGLDERGRLYFTMRRVDGRDLAAIYGLARRGEEGWSTTRVLGVLLKVCEALAYAHSKGVIHRDLKPANVMVGRFGEVYVMDWGLAKVLGRPPARDGAAPGAAAEPVDPGAREGASPRTGGALESVRNDEIAADPGTPLGTVDGAVLGTPAYMSPEQAEGRIDALDERSDVYALGAMLYHLLAGSAPYRARGPEAREVLRSIARNAPEPLSELAPATPPQLVAIVERAMAREQAQRYPSVSALAEDLRAWLEGRVVRAYRTGVVVEVQAWVRRNRAFAATILAAVVLAAVGATTFVLAEARHIQRNQRLSDLYLVDRALSNTGLDGPPTPDRVAGHERWLAEAEALLARLPGYARDLERALRAEGRGQAALVPAAAPAAGSADSAGASESPGAVETLRELVAKLESLRAPDGGTIASVRRKLELVRMLQERTLDGVEARARWTVARESIADAAQCPQYAGLALAPQFGLLPIGRDPQSGLWEFAHLASGEPARRDPGTGALAIEPATGIVLVLVPAGTLDARPELRIWGLVGGRRGEAGPEAPRQARRGAREDLLELPVDPGSQPVMVRIGPRFVAKHELTQAQCTRLLGSNPSSCQPGRLSETARAAYQLPELHPVESLSAHDCSALLAAFGLRLPSDLEWEHAARGGVPAAARERERARQLPDEREETHEPVVQAPRNPFGLHGMAGNVWEWCTVVTDDPLLLAHTGGFAACGGSHRTRAAASVPVYRSVMPPDRRQADLGVRPARAIDP